MPPGSRRRLNLSLDLNAAVAKGEEEAADASLTSQGLIHALLLPSPLAADGPGTTATATAAMLMAVMATTLTAGASPSTATAADAAMSFFSNNHVHANGCTSSSQGHTNGPSRDDEHPPGSSSNHPPPHSTSTSGIAPLHTESDHPMHMATLRARHTASGESAAAADAAVSSPSHSPASRRLSVARPVDECSDLRSRSPSQGILEDLSTAESFRSLQSFLPIFASTPQPALPSVAVEIHSSSSDAAAVGSAPWNGQRPPPPTGTGMRGELSLRPLSTIPRVASVADSASMYQSTDAPARPPDGAYFLGAFTPSSVVEVTTGYPQAGNTQTGSNNNGAASAIIHRSYSVSSGLASGGPSTRTTTPGPAHLIGLVDIGHSGSAEVGGVGGMTPQALQASFDQFFKLANGEDALEDMGELGRGRGGSVRRARHKITGEGYAIKDIRCHSKEHRDQLRAELRALFPLWGSTTATATATAAGASAPTARPPPSRSSDEQRPPAQTQQEQHMLREHRRHYGSPDLQSSRAIFQSGDSMPASPTTPNSPDVPPHAPHTLVPGSDVFMSSHPSLSTKMPSGEGDAAPSQLQSRQSSQPRRTSPDQQHIPPPLSAAAFLTQSLSCSQDTSSCGSASHRHQHSNQRGVLPDGGSSSSAGSPSSPSAMHRSISGSGLSAVRRMRDGSPSPTQQSGATAAGTATQMVSPSPPAHARHHAAPPLSAMPPSPRIAPTPLPHPTSAAGIAGTSMALSPSHAVRRRPSSGPSKLCTDLHCQVPRSLTTLPAPADLSAGIMRTMSAAQQGTHSPSRALQSHRVATHTSAPSNAQAPTQRESALCRALSVSVASLPGQGASYVVPPTPLYHSHHLAGATSKCGGDGLQGLSTSASPFTPTGADVAPTAQGPSPPLPGPHHGHHHLVRGIAFHVPEAANCVVAMELMDGSLDGLLKKRLKKAVSRAQLQALHQARLVESTSDPLVASTADSSSFGGGGGMDSLLLGDNRKGAALEGLIFPEDIVAAIARDVLLALRYMHDVRRLAHRDIKPGNLLFRAEDGIVKVADFGLCTRIRRPQSPPSQRLPPPLAACEQGSPLFLSSGSADAPSYSTATATAAGPVTMTAAASPVSSVPPSAAAQPPPHHARTGSDASNGGFGQVLASPPPDAPVDVTAPIATAPPPSATGRRTPPTGTSPKRFAGTVQYMAPECLSSEPPAAAADIWALGITLLELLAGRNPFISLFLKMGSSANLLHGGGSAGPATPAAGGINHDSCAGSPGASSHADSRTTSFRRSTSSVGSSTGLNHPHQPRLTSPSNFYGSSGSGGGYGGSSSAGTGGRTPQVVLVEVPSQLDDESPGGSVGNSKNHSPKEGGRVRCDPNFSPLGGGGTTSESASAHNTPNGVLSPASDGTTDPATSPSKATTTTSIHVVVPPAATSTGDDATTTGTCTGTGAGKHTIPPKNINSSSHCNFSISSSSNLLPHLPGALNTPQPVDSSPQEPELAQVHQSQGGGGGVGGSGGGTSATTGTSGTSILSGNVFSSSGISAGGTGGVVSLLASSSFGAVGGSLHSRSTSRTMLHSSRSFSQNHPSSSSAGGSTTGGVGLGLVVSVEARYWALVREFRKPGPLDFPQLHQRAASMAIADVAAAAASQSFAILASSPGTPMHVHPHAGSGNRTGMTTLGRRDSVLIARSSATPTDELIQLRRRASVTLLLDGALVRPTPTPVAAGQRPPLPSASSALTSPNHHHYHHHQHAACPACLSPSSSPAAAAAVVAVPVPTHRGVPPTAGCHVTEGRPIPSVDASGPPTPKDPLDDLLSPPEVAGTTAAAPSAAVLSHLDGRGSGAALQMPQVGPGLYRPLSTAASDPPAASDDVSASPPSRHTTGAAQAGALAAVGRLPPITAPVSMMGSAAPWDTPQPQVSSLVTLQPPVQLSPHKNNHHGNKSVISGEAFSSPAAAGPMHVHTAEDAFGYSATAITTSPPSTSVLSSACIAFIGRCLEKDPLLRPTAAALLQDPFLALCAPSHMLADFFGESSDDEDDEEET